MPLYEITDQKTGQTLEIESNREPTQQEIKKIFAEQQQNTQPKDLKLTESALKQDPSWIESSKKI